MANRQAAGTAIVTAAEAGIPGRSEPRRWGHQGVWSPGVRLFRRFSFGVKAGLISAVFLLVVAQLLALLIWPMLKTMRVTEVERVGVAVQLQLIEQALPAAASMLADATARGRIDRGALESLGKIETAAMARAQGQFDLTEPFKFVRQAAEPLAQTPSDRDEAFGKVDNLLQQVLRTLASVSDLSLLSTEPDHVSHGLMEFATQDGLQLFASIRRVAELGAAAQASGEVSAATRRIVLGETYLVLREVEQLFGYFDGQAKSEPDLAAALAHQEAFNAINAFVRLTRRALPAEGAGPGDGSALRQAGATAGEQILKLASRSLRALDERLVARSRDQQRHLVLQVALVTAGLAVAGYLFYCFYIVTHGGMKEIKRNIDGMAAGRLDTQPQPWGKDEAAEVLMAIRHMQQSLRSLIGDVRDCASDILGHSNQVSQGATDLSQRSERTAARVQGSASTVGLIADQSRDTAQEVQRSAGLSRTGANNAAQSQHSFSHLADRIQQLRGSSQKVGEIVGVIDSIAFQTNILALNAAVEAARAGEQGRGFAVVASEVRALAQRSATAAREIKQLVGQSSEHTERGTEAVHAAGQAVERLVGDMQTISVALEQVAARQSDQVHQVQAVAQSFHELDQDAQQNAALVEETTAAAVSMRRKAEQLAEAAGRFQL